MPREIEPAMEPAMEPEAQVQREPQVPPESPAQPSRVEAWKTHTGEHVLSCKLFAAPDDSLVCGIMQEATNSVAVQGLPDSWPGEPPANTAQLECGHVFHPAALALHFLVTDMRCPVCRAGFTESMHLDSIPAEDRDVYESKAASIKHADEWEGLMPGVDQITDVLKELELKLSVSDAALEMTSVRTPILFSEAQLVAIQAQRPQDAPHTSNFAVHRSFQRLLVALLHRQARQARAFPERRVQFVLKHPLVPVSIRSDEMSIDWACGNLFDPGLGGPRRALPLFSPMITGSDPVAYVRVEFLDDCAVPKISIELNVLFLLHIANYVSTVLASIREAVEQNTSTFDSPGFIEITSQTINGIVLDAASVD